MQKRSLDSPIQSSRKPCNDPDEVLQLDKPALVKALDRLQSAHSIAALRRRASEMKQSLKDRASLLHSSRGDGDEIEFTSGYLSEELDQIAASQTLERALYYVERLKKSVIETMFSHVNDINLNRWKEYGDIYLDSLWTVERRENSGAHSAGYWGNFIPQIPRQMMKRYTKRGDWVLDTFAGSGTTAIEGQRLGRNTIGVELQREVAEKARRLIRREPNDYGVVSEIVTGDSATIDYRSLLQKHDRRSVQLIIMHPPYFDIIRFSDDQRDLSNATSTDDFLQMLGVVVEKSALVLDKGRYMALTIGDKYARGEWIPLGFFAMNEVLKRGFALKSIVVKNFEQTTGKRQQKELWKYRALVGGFYIFKHEYIFVFKKQ
jgi:DNA modification methylase